jgi:hypothetical protein
MVIISTMKGQELYHWVGNSHAITRLGGRPASIFSNAKISGLRTQIYLIIVVVEEWHYLSRMH